MIVSIGSESEHCIGNPRGFVAIRRHVLINDMASTGFDNHGSFQILNESQVDANMGYLQGYTKQIE